MTITFLSRVLWLKWVVSRYATRQSLAGYRIYGWLFMPDIRHCPYIRHITGYPAG